MRSIFFIGICFISSACGTGVRSNQRTYVITHVGQTTAEADVDQSAADDDTFNESE